MARCCGGSGCSCDVQSGVHTSVTGTGSAADPYVIDADVALTVVDNATFDLVQSGSGIASNPWSLEVKYKTTAKLDDIPDVNATTPLNGQVLGYNTATSTWGPIPPTTAASGSVTHDTSLVGDGSAGSPLQVQEDPARFLSTSAPGLGVNTDGQNRMVLHYTNAAARSGASLTPQLNALTMLDDKPGLVDYWDGGAWQTVNIGTPTTLVGSALMEMSGAYVAGTSIIQRLIKNATFTTDASGGFDVLSTSDISGRAGVLSVEVQSVGSVPFTVNVSPLGTSVSGTAYRVDDGSPLSSVSLSASIVAYVY